MTILRAPTVATIVAAVAMSGPLAAQSLLSKQPARLTVTTEPPARVVPGRPFTIELRLTPVTGVHVYAPGNPNYIPVAIEVVPTTGVKSDPAVFPPGEDLFFGPLKETVKVYSGPFVVKLPLSIDPKAVKTAETIVRGKVSYQACDDRVCFPPQSAPFEARLNLKRRSP